MAITPSAGDGQMKLAPLQSLGIQRHPQTVMPKNLQQITSLPAEDVQITSMWIVVQRFLNLQGKTIHPASHISRSSRQPNANTGRRDDHRRSALTTRRSVAKPTSGP